MRQVQIGAILAAMACATLCQAQATTQPAAEPATQPTTAAAVVPIDTTSPRGALKVLAKAMEGGDATVLKSVLYSANPTEEKMAGAMADMADAYAKLRTAAVTAFGAKEAEVLTGDTSSQMSKGMAMIDSATETITGDDAKVVSANATMVLKRVDGAWKLPMSEIAKGVDASTVDERLAEVAIQTHVITEGAGEIAAGKFKTPAEAVQGLQGKMLRAAMQHAAATTRPATEPATAPAPGGL